MGELNRDLAAAHHSAREHAVELVNLARTLKSAPSVEPSHGEEFAHLLRFQRQTELRAITALSEVDRLRSLLAQADANQDQMKSAAMTANERLQALQGTRRFRLASLIASPLDRLRTRLGMTR